MMMETAVDYHLWRKTFVFNASVKVYQIAFKQWNKLNQYHYLPSVFTCKTDEDCYYPNGYCHARKCECYPNYQYAEDCSHHGCKYIQQTFEFLSTFVWIYQYIHSKCLQGFTGVLRGNQSAGFSNLQGLLVTCNVGKKFSGKTVISVGDMFYRDNAGKTPHKL